MNESLIQRTEEGSKIIDMIKGSDISRNIPKEGETEIIMQRHEKYITDENSEKRGSLYEDAQEKAYEQTREILIEKLTNLKNWEKEKVIILLVSSNTRYKGGGMRSMETAEMIVRAIKDVMREQGMDEKSQLLNNSERFDGDDIIPASEFQEPRMFEESPEFFDYLCKKYGKLTPEFWEAFEKDFEKEKREEMGAEGPAQMLDRYSYYVKVLKRFSKMYHNKNPEKRLIIWTVSHFDVISPYVKNKVTQTDPNELLKVDYGGGISVNISKDQRATCELGGKQYDVIN